MTHRVYTIYSDNSLELAVEFMLKTNQDILPVIDRTSKLFIGVITHNDVLKVFEQRFHEQNHIQRHIAMGATTIRAFKKGRRMLTPRAKR
jgi:CBS-domain-containing membrane protein